MQKKIVTYEELATCTQVFNENRLEIMIVEGAPGTGKSSMIKQSIKDKPTDAYCWIEGRISAAALYEKLYTFRGTPIFIDDVDGLYRDREAVNMLKCLCQTEKVKTIMWNTLRKTEYPTEFQTESKVCVITNSWKSLNKHIGAVEDRGLLVRFLPSPTEVHEYVRRLPIYNEEIWSFIGENLFLIKEPSIRYYRNALQLLGSALDWRAILIESFGLDEDEQLVVKLRQQKMSENKRAALFRKMCGKSERTYWRVKAELYPSEQVPQSKLA